VIIMGFCEWKLKTEDVHVQLTHRLRNDCLLRFRDGIDDPC